MERNPDVHLPALFLGSEQSQKKVDYGQNEEGNRGWLARKLKPMPNVAYAMRAMSLPFRISFPLVTTSYVMISVYETGQDLFFLR
jgi:hypothetical protein